MMKKFTQLTLLVLLTSLILFFTACKKDKQTSNKTMYSISATLSGAQESPAVTTNETGTVTGTYDVSTNTLTYNVTWSNLSENATIAHFQGPAPSRCERQCHGSVYFYCRCNICHRDCGIN